MRTPDHGAAVHLDTERARALGGERAVAHVDHDAFDAGAAQGEHRLVGLVAVEEEHRTAAHRHPVASQILMRGTREHHARQVVAREGDQPLERTGGEHHAPGADDPQPLPQAIETGSLGG